MRVGIDLEQFARDPYGSGIQRVLQQLAKFWPTEDIEADFIFPDGSLFALLSAESAHSILSIPFSRIDSDADLRDLVRDAIQAAPGSRVREADLLSLYTAWLLPEVSYLPEVLERFRIFNASMITVMIGFDALPMTEPRNYRFPPGMAPYVSDYFRLLASADRVVCISEHARSEMWEALRRPMNLATDAAHPGGDHIAITAAQSVAQPITFVRLGTLEARKMPVEILEAFLEAAAPNTELLFIGGGSSSDQSINDSVQRACEQSGSVRWITGATDDEVQELIAQADVFLALGTEGYGIPVLEAIASGTPVVFAGIQPAAEIMESSGATRLTSHDHEALVAMFRTYSDTARVTELASTIDISRIPRWKNFTDAVAKLCRS